MWVIELNFAGHQFTHRVPDRRQRFYRLATRNRGLAPVAASQPARGVRTLQTVPATKTRTKRGSTRSNMLISAAEVMRERGAAGVTIDEVLARSGAPRGSVYYHFPEGRNQILAEALRWAGDTIADSIDAAAEQGCAASRPRIHRVLGADAAGERLRRGLSGRRGRDRLRQRRGGAGRDRAATSSGAGAMH